MRDRLEKETNELKDKLDKEIAERKVSASSSEKIKRFLFDSVDTMTTFIVMDISY